MRSIKRQVIRFLRFLKGETVTNERGQIKRFAVILGLAMLLGLALSPIALVFTRSARPGEGTPLVQATATISKTTATPTKIVATGPVKGLTDNPAYQWWRWPNQAQPDSWWGDGQNAQTLGQQISLMQELGVKLFREELVWPFVAPSMPGGAAYDSAQARNPNWSGYQWGRFDLIVQLTSQAGIQLVPEVVYSPDWASGITATTNGGPNAPPTAAQYFGDFVFAAATRYKGKIHYWEMWNEPDYAAHTWNGTAQQYVDLVLKPGYQSVKQIDSTAQVLIGGLAGDTNMQKFYTAGAQPYFDIGNVHTYYEAAAGDATGVTHVRGAMNQNGDTAKPLWLTEFGWSSAQDASVCFQDTQPSPSGEQTQAQLVSDMYRYTGVQALFFYQLHDTGVYDASGCIKGVHWGLLTHDLSRRKPSFDAYKAAVGGTLPALALISPHLAASESPLATWHVAPDLVGWDEKSRQFD